MRDKTRFYMLLALLICTVALAVFLVFYTKNAALTNLNT